MTKQHIHTISCITDAHNIVTSYVNNNQTVLIVLDIDDTLITIPKDSPDYLNYLKKYNIEHHQVYNLCDNIPEARIDYICNIAKVPCQPETGTTLQELVDKYHVVGLTSRCHTLHESTYNDLVVSNVDIIDQNPFYKLNSDYHDVPNKIAYWRNVLSISGQNKGTVLMNFLQDNNHTYDIIVLIDDTIGKIHDFVNAFANTETLAVGIHYVKYNI